MQMQLTMHLAGCQKRDPASDSAQPAIAEWHKSGSAVPLAAAKLPKQSKTESALNMAHMLLAIKQNKSGTKSQAEAYQQSTLC
jgi:hypothetical protein